MKTIYYSELLNKQFATEEECLNAEKAYNEKVLAKQEAENKLKEEKAARAKEVENAYTEFKNAEKVYAEKRNKYIELRNGFVKDYDKFHMTIRDESPIITFEDLIRSLF